MHDYRGESVSSGHFRPLFDFSIFLFLLLIFLSLSLSLSLFLPTPLKNSNQPQEAIARALAELEPTTAPAAAVLSALNAVVDSQKRHDPAVRARCGEEAEAEEAKPQQQGNAGRGESWHKRLHERRERKRAAKAARDAALGIVASEGARKHEEEGERPDRGRSRNRNLSAGLADGRNKFGFKNPPSNSCAECMPLSEEVREARKADKLAARIANRRRKQEEEAAAVAAAGANEAVATEG